MKLTKEEKQLKEAMKIILRDGKNGRLYNAARERFKSLYTADRVNNIGVEDCNRVNFYVADAKTIINMIG